MARVEEIMVAGAGPWLSLKGARTGVGLAETTQGYLQYMTCLQVGPVDGPYLGQALPA